MSDPWFRFFPSDWISGVSGLSAAERGVYVTLLAIIYDRGGPVERDDARLARQCGLPKAGFARALHALIETGKITEDDGCIFNNRAKNELTERENRKLTASEAAKSRWVKTKENQQSENETALREQCEPNATRARIPQPQPDKEGNNLETDNRNICPKPAAPLRTRKSYPEDFEEFWSIYPTDRIMSKALAAKEWARLSPDDRRAATASIPGFLEYCRRQPTYRAVHACRYLSQRRFDAANLPIPPPVKSDAQDGRRFVPAI